MCSRPEGKRRVNIAQEVRDIIKVAGTTMELCRSVTCANTRRFTKLSAQSLIGITTERMFAREWTSKRTGKEKKQCDSV